MHCTVSYDDMVGRGIHNCFCLEIGIVLFLLVKIKAHLSYFE